MTHPHALAERKYQISYGEALVVCTLYISGYPPEEAASDASDFEKERRMQSFIESLSDLKSYINNQIRDSKYFCYSNKTLLPIHRDTAISLISRNDTSNLLITAGDLVPSGYANNSLPDVIENARAIIRDNPLIREAVVPNLINTTDAIETSDFSHDKVEATRNSNSNDGKITKVRIIGKLRVNSLDALILKAIDRAKSLDMGTVFIQLKEIALSGEAPFNGVVEGSALQYTNDNDVLKLLTKDSLGKRLKKHTL